MSNLYLVHRKSVRYDQWDVYLGAVVVADSEEQARLIHPSGDERDWEAYSSGWVDKSEAGDLQVTYLGQADPGFKAGTVVLDSFKAG